MTCSNIIPQNRIFLIVAEALLASEPDHRRSEMMAWLLRAHVPCRKEDAGKTSDTKSCRSTCISVMFQRFSAVGGSAAARKHATLRLAGQAGFCSSFRHLCLSLHKEETCQLPILEVHPVQPEVSRLIHDHDHGRVRWSRNSGRGSCGTSQLTSPGMEDGSLWPMVPSKEMVPSREDHDKIDESRMRQGKGKWKEVS
jgi:hypothetical protein